jgi:hypothetical protein
LTGLDQLSSSNVDIVLGLPEDCMLDALKFRGDLDIEIQDDEELMMKVAGKLGR